MTRPVVLNTRPAGGATELSRLLRAAGFEPVEAPAVEVVGAVDAPALAPVADRLAAGGYAWAVFPSANAADFLLDALHNLGTTSAEFRRASIVAGEGTARVLAARGVRVDHVLARFSADAALEVILAERPQGGVLVPRAAEGREELVDGLRGRGLRVDAPVVYRTQAAHPDTLEPAAGLLRRGDVAAVTFTSPSAVRALAGGLAALGYQPSETLWHARLVCIGQTTAAAVRAIGLTVAGVAEQTTMRSLVAAVSSALTGAGEACLAPASRGPG